MNNKDLERAIRDGAYMMANLQQRERDLKSNNLEMSKENEELRTFGEDGRVIRENMIRLKKERDDRQQQLDETLDDL